MNKFAYLFSKCAFRKIFVFLLIFSLAFHFNIMDKNNDIFSSASSIVNKHLYTCNGNNATAWEGADDYGGFTNGALFSISDYQNIIFDDDASVKDSSYTNMYQYHRFDFSIDENVEDIVGIDIMWKGSGGSEEIENFGYSLWVKTEGVYIKVDEGAESDKDTLFITYSSVSHDLNDILSNGHIYVAAQSECRGLEKRPPVAGYASVIETYYIEIEISYSAEEDPLSSFSVSYPSSVEEGQSFDITVNNNVSITPVEDAEVAFVGITGHTDSSGIVSFHSPYVDFNTSHSFSVSKEGYENFTASILVLNNESPQEDPDLEISTFSSVIEGLGFSVTVTSDDVAVENAIVNFSSFSKSTNSEGITTFNAPYVEENTSYLITAYKSGYNSAESSIVVLNNESPEENPQLEISSPLYADEGEIFEVIITSEGVAIEGVMISFSDDIYYTDGYGKVDVSAPNVDYNKSILLNASKSGYLSDETQVIVLNTDSQIYPELVILSESSLSESENFTVSVTSQGDAVKDVLVRFNNNELYTNSNGEVTFYTPAVDSKTYFTITASKEGFESDSKTISVLDDLETSIVLVLPNGGENLSGIFDISWNILNPPTQNLEDSLDVDISYKKDTGSWILIAEDLDIDAMVYSWNTDAVENYDKYFLRVSLSSSEENWEDVSDSSFSIYNDVKESNGWIYGNVSENNQNHTPIENAEICVYESVSSGNVLVKRCRYSDEVGYYNISCSNGLYAVKVTKKGYVTKIFENINIASSVGKKLDIFLNKTETKASQSITDYTISEEIKKGTIGGIVDIREEKQVRLYQDINVNISSYDITSETGINLLISGEKEVGTRVIIYLGAIDEKENIQVFYDGVLIKSTDDIQAFFEENSEESKYILTSSNEEQIAIVYIPHFSEHQITIKISDALTQINAVLYYAGFFILVAVMFLGIGFVRKRYY